MNKENYSKILDVVAHTLGENLAEGIKINFDYKPAVNSIKYFNYLDIPRIISAAENDLKMRYIKPEDIVNHSLTASQN